MSAIAGIVHFDGRPVERTDLERMGAALEDLGRDKRFVVPGASAGFVSRISIFTAEDRLERQPVALADRSLLVFDGRLDNREELQQTLGLSDSESRLLSDSALTACAWERWQQACLQHLVGNFALAHWLPRERRLILARSAPQGRPLYVHRSGQSIYFASSPAGLFALPQIPRELDEAALGDLLLRTRSDGNSLFAGIEVVRNAHWVSYTAAGSESHRYWQLDPDRTLRFAREEEAWEVLRPLFAKVTASHLRSVHPIGVQMSGGLDSAAVAGQAAQLLAGTKQRLRGYTRVPNPGVMLKRDGLTYNDERSRVAIIARQHPNLEPNFVYADAEPVLDNLPQFFGKSYTAFAVSPTFVTGYEPLYQRAASDGVRVLLHGSRGNASFSWDGLPHLGTLLRSGRWLTLAHELRALRRFRGKVRKVMHRELVQAMVPPHWRERYFAWRNGSQPWAHYSSIAPQFAQQSGAAARLRERDNIKLYRSALDAWHRRASAFEQMDSEWAYTLQERHGLDWRDPTADRRLVEFCVALPHEYFLKDGVERRLARFGMAHLIPSAICRDPRWGRHDADWAARMHRDADAVAAALDALASDTTVTRYLDVPRMKHLWQARKAIDWPHESDAEAICYKQALLGCIAIGQFVRWFEGRN